MFDRHLATPAGPVLDPPPRAYEASKRALDESSVEGIVFGVLATVVAVATLVIAVMAYRRQRSTATLPADAEQGYELQPAHNRSTRTRQTQVKLALAAMWNTIETK